MQDIFSAEGLISLLILMVMEITLGVDNVLFVSIISGKLAKHEQNKARLSGLGLALLLRIGLLFSITQLAHLQHRLFGIGHYSITAHNLIMLAGGVFLMYKSITEINDKLAGEHNQSKPAGPISFPKAIIQIALLDLVFSFDSILTAVGVAKNIWIMIIAMVASMVIMTGASAQMNRVFHNYPSIKMLALAFLLMIGFLLVLDGLPQELHIQVPKSYLYVAMAFSAGVEFLNIRMRRRSAKN